MIYLYKKFFISAYNFSIVRTLWFNLQYFRCIKPKIYIGKKTKIFLKGGRLLLNSPVYIDSRNGGQFWHDSTIILEKNSTLEIAENVNFFSGAQIKCFEHGKITIGDNSYFSGPLVMHAMKSITIGKRCSISWNVTIIDSNFHILEKSSEIISESIIIGDDVWIGCNVTILKGVTICNGAIIAAGSVVTKSIRKNELYAGNPAKLIRKLDE